MMLIQQKCLMQRTSLYVNSIRSGLSATDLFCYRVSAVLSVVLAMIISV